MSPRKRFIGALVFSVLLAPLAAEAQQAGKVPRIGVLDPGPETTRRHLFENLRQSLAALGYVEGQTIVFVKLLELLKETVPGVSRVAVLADPANPSHAIPWRELTPAARALGVQLQAVDVRTADRLEEAFAAMTRQRAGALFGLPQPFTLAHRTRIVAQAARSRLPAIYGFRESVEAGGLMSYGTSLPDTWRRAAVYVDKILKGAKPADLPVEQPTKFELINPKAAKALGLTIPDSILIRAD